MALSLLEEVAKPMVSVVAGQVTEGFRVMVGFESELNNLKVKIDPIENAVEKMTEERDPAVEGWLRKVIRIIRNAENMMDVLAYEKYRHVVLKRRLKKTLSGKVRLVFLPLERLYLRTKMSCWIRGINSDIEAAVKNHARLIKDLNDVVSSSASSSRPAATNITDDQLPLQQVRRNVDTSLFVGRDNDVAAVVDMLLNNPSQVSGQGNNLLVVAIVGLGGLGKTTLAKQVCETEPVKIHFSERIWISDLKDFNIEKILNKMVEFVGMGKYEDASRVTAIRKLEKHLGGKRYLLVLDDVWNVNKKLWRSMKNALEEIGGSKDSMVLTTTRDIEVTKAMHASPVHCLSGLSIDDSWSLFEKIAFANDMSGEDFALEPIGRNIVAKCKGVPLAIRSIAGILQGKRDLDVWKNIEESDLWGIKQDETGVLPSLKLSYNHLSHPKLKKCFTLCASVPKGWVFWKKNTIWRWMALGLIQNPGTQKKTMEEIAEDYINELLSISFLLVWHTDELGKAIAYQMHDLVYDMARSLAMHERLYLEPGNKNENYEALDIQHLTIVKHEKLTWDFPKKMDLENVRSLEMVYNMPRGLLMHNVKYLRVLSLYFAIEVVPESIARLKCLKFLDLSCNPITVLPECVMELYNLESLSLYGCYNISTLPKGLSNLINLRHLGLEFYFCPSEEGVIEQLSQLQTVPPLQLSEGGFQVSELGSLNNMKGNLLIKGLELIPNKSEAEKSKLSMKPRVERLQLSWDDDNNCIQQEEVLDGLHPNPSLKVLSIYGYGGEKFPSWIMRMSVAKDHNDVCGADSLCNMMKIELIDCRRCEQLPTLGHLPCLKILDIRNMEKLKSIGSEFYGGEELLLRGNTKQLPSKSVGSIMSFTSLKKLQLIGLNDLEEWCEPEPGSRSWTGFPSLEVLVIERCGKLRKAPNNFPMLKELIVKDMSNGYPVMNIMSNESSLSCLKKLEIEEVEELTHIPEKVGVCTSLEVLIVEWCPKLVYIPNLSGLSALRQIQLFGNYELKGAPEGLESCKSLEQVWIACCEKVETLPDLSGLSRLWNLNMMAVRKMISEPPEWLYNLPSLRVLHIGGYLGLNEFPDFSCLLKIPSLEWLFMYGWDELQSLPQQLQLFTGLKRLSIFTFDKVEELPDWLGNLSSLQVLGLVQCQKLKKLPSKKAMARLCDLRFLEIIECPMLEEALKSNGAEHHKIEGFHHKIEGFHHLFYFTIEATQSIEEVDAQPV